MSAVPAIGGADLLHLLATALVDLSRMERPTEPIYPRRVRQAYNLLVLTCLRNGVTPPGSVPDMVTWSAKSAPVDWGIGLELDEPLVCELTRAPTEACLEWRMTVADPLAEHFENVQLKTALAVCRNDGNPDTYVAYRRLLIERPVLTRAELDDLLGEVELLPVADLLPDCYPEAPAAYRQDGRYAVCAGCGCLLRPQRNGGWTCELDRCRRHGEAAIGRLIDLATTRGVHHLALPLRTFITGPGLVEIELESELRKLGLQVDMWPEFDAYDLAVTFQDGTVWAIDAKDRADPRLLGRSMTSLPTRPDWNQFFLVVPDHRVAQREDYISTFKRHCDPEIAEKLRLYSVREFLKLVRRHLRQSKEVPHA